VLPAGECTSASCCSVVWEAHPDAIGHWPALAGKGLLAVFILRQTARPETEWAARIRPLRAHWTNHSREWPMHREGESARCSISGPDRAIENRAVYAPAVSQSRRWPGPFHLGRESAEGGRCTIYGARCTLDCTQRCAVAQPGAARQRTGTGETPARMANRRRRPGRLTKTNLPTFSKAARFRTPDSAFPAAPRFCCRHRWWPTESARRPWTWMHRSLIKSSRRRGPETALLRPGPRRLDAFYESLVWCAVSSTALLLLLLLLLRCCSCERGVLRVQRGKHGEWDTCCITPAANGSLSHLCPFRVIIIGSTTTGTGQSQST
jgi:hypothetical protein